MKKEQKSWKTYAQFAAIVLVSAAVGGVFGFYSVMAGKNFLQLSEQLNVILAALGNWWFVPGYLTLVIGTVYYFRGKALLSRAEEEDDAFEEANRRLCLGLLFSSVATVWMFIALGMVGQHIRDRASQLATTGLLILLVVQLVWETALQALIVRATKVLYPEKRGNVFSSRFQKDWYQSCDEAERQQIGQCSYFSFRVMAMIFPILMILLFFMASMGVAQPGWILLVGGLWMVQQLSYQCMAYHLDHGKKKNSV